ncbi:MAG: peptidylprolyl isomerase [Terracidiphilus sp.]
MKLTSALLAPALALAFAASAFAQTAPQPAKPAPKAPAAPPARVVMDTSMGRITCRFFPKSAPLAVANFASLANGTKAFIDPVTGTRQSGKRYYDGTIFHRVIPGFMIQGGDPTGTGTGSPGYMFVDEFDPSLNFDVPGRLAMANSGPNTNGSQFFVTEVPYASLSQHYTIFGQCDDASVQVVKAITAVPRDDRDKPFTPVVLKKVTILREGQPLPPVPGAAAPKPAPKP